MKKTSLMMFVALLFALSFGALGFAQQGTGPAPIDPKVAPPPPPMDLMPDSAQPLEEIAGIVQAIDSASSEIMLATNVLRSQEIAEALRAAMVSRGVSVYILTPEENLEDPNSYLYSLALAGASVRVGPIEGSFLTLDRQTVVVGLLVTGVKGVMGYENKDMTLLVPDETYTASYVEGFYQSFELAPPLDLNSVIDSGTPEGGEQ
ncbi:MAG: phospholipase D-like domain-containing protein [Trueperaceae bacterium]